MVLNEFPDHTRPDLDAPCPVYGWPNMIIHATGSGIAYPEHLGPLSIKCAFGGRELYETAEQRYAVSDASYLLLNDGQRYASRVDEGQEIETFCIFFRPHFASEILAASLGSSDTLLDDPFLPYQYPITFFERIYPHDRQLSPLLLHMRRTMHNTPVTKGWIEERYHELLDRLLGLHYQTEEEIARIPAVKRSTRVEIYRRLYQAREYMDAHLGRHITLQQIALAACFSTHHFLRLFKQAFRETPHQYLTRKRLERACELLIRTQRPITTICTDIGFESLGSFSWLFRKRFGISPDTYRRTCRGEHHTLDGTAEELAQLNTEPNAVD